MSQQTANPSSAAASARVRIRALATLLAGGLAAAACAQAPPAPPAQAAVQAAPVTNGAPAPGAAPAAASADDLETLVGRIALYPDDLVSIILPAATNPLQIVQADRFLAKRKTDPKAPVDESWDDAVKSLINYPEVITMMSNDLDWTSAMGEAVVADQGAVLGAIQAFRRRAQAAGNLKDDGKQVVVVEKEIIKIQPADPQVIYVPQYQPAAVVSGAYYGWGYYPTAYPSYYYPYAPGAAFATGLIWGAAISSAWHGSYSTNWGGNNINVNRNTNIQGGDRTINTGDRTRATSAGGNSTAWKSNKQPGQVSRSVGSTSGQRVGDRSAGGAGGGARASAAGAGGAGAGAGAGRASAGQSTAFSGYGSGSQARSDSARGASSRSSSASAGAGAGASRSTSSMGASGAGRSSAGSFGGGGGGGRGGGGGGGGRGGGRR